MLQGSGGAVFVPNQTSPVSVPAQLPPISVAASLTSAGSLPQPPSSNSGKGRSVVRSFGMRGGLHTAVQEPRLLQDCLAARQSSDACWVTRHWTWHEPTYSEKSHFGSWLKLLLTRHTQTCGCGFVPVQTGTPSA